MKTVHANYALVDEENKVISLFENRPKEINNEVVVENPDIYFHENGRIEISGNSWDWEYARKRVFVEDLIKKPMFDFTDYGYKTILDFIKGTRKPYVYGVYVCEQTKLYHSEMNTWLIKYHAY